MHLMIAACGPIVASITDRRERALTAKLYAVWTLLSQPDINRQRLKVMAKCSFSSPVAWLLQGQSIYSHNDEMCFCVRACVHGKWRNSKMQHASAAVAALLNLLNKPSGWEWDTKLILWPICCAHYTCLRLHTSCLYTFVLLTFHWWVFAQISFPGFHWFLHNIIVSACA